MKRAYRRLLASLQPHSTLFLGDLFDGGREWGASNYESPDKKYKQYDTDFWLAEYQRFQDMFVKTWNDVGISTIPSDEGRRIITSLPGNHDLGFAGGINPEVKSRFEAHFGPTNRIDVLGNHTFVSLDTVSLSAMDQVDPETGASGAGDGSAAATKSSQIWKPVEAYLSDAKAIRERLVRQEIQKFRSRTVRGDSQAVPVTTSPKFRQVIQNTAGTVPASSPQNRLGVSTSQFPTIILSHVPLYRSDAAAGACGPLRERGTHIPLAQGYQYQNVLTPLISKDIVDHLDANQITQIYSGDDHDYCEVEHDEFTGRIREITVKSVSWAMGVRKPGVQLASLWNPVDLDVAIINHQSEDGNKVRNMPKHTVQNHMCLLPDQLSIFIRYGELLGLTLILLITRAILWRPSSSPSKPDLEDRLSKSTTYYTNDDPTQQSSQFHHENGSISSTLSAYTITSRRGGGGPPQSQLPPPSYGNIPLSARSRTPSPSKSLRNPTYEADSDDWGNPTTTSDRIAYAHVHHDPRLSSSPFLQQVLGAMGRIWLFRRSRTKTGEFFRSMVYVGGPVLCVYFWLLWRDM